MRNHHPFNILLILVIAACAFIVGCRIQATPEEVLNEATQLIEQQKYEAAVLLLHPFVYHHQDNFKAHYLLGQAFLNTDADNDRTLYTARYYFKKARDLAANANQREKAALKYADAKLLMGKGGQSAEVLYKTAIVAGNLGRKRQAVRLSVQAASIFIEEDEYEDAREVCALGLRYAGTPDQRLDLKLGLATAYFFENEYSESLDTLTEISIDSRQDSQNTHITALDSAYLLNAVNLMMLKPERKKLAFWKSEFNDDTKEQFATRFESMADYIRAHQSYIDPKRGKLVADSCKIVAEFAKDNGMHDEARQAYEFSRSLYTSARMEDEALSVAKELNELEG